MGKLLCICLLLSLFDAVLLVDNPNVAEGCFCKLHGEIDDCSCRVESVDSFNNLKVYPRLNSLLSHDYFRYWRVNLQKECPFWPDDSRCALKDCAVNGCKEDDLPERLKPNGSKPKNKYSAEANEKQECDDEKLGDIDTTISEASREAFREWRIHDDAQENFCELDDDNSSGLTYVDLLLNPERYTGYKGHSPHRIWHSIYNENCFRADKKDFTYLTSRPGSADEGMCLEKRIFYRLVSGLHTSINIHLSAMYLFQDKLGMMPDRWGPNVEEFRTRFNPETTSDRGPQWLKNLYFTYLVELRALAKAAPYLQKEFFFTGKEDDADVKTAVHDLLNVIKSFPDHFDESKLFKSDKDTALQLKKEFKEKFMNISRIMDCVGCDKCKLWGKLQITGLGTALKILFSGDSMSADSTVTQELKHQAPTSQFQLRRQEIVALFNAFGRLSRSIHEVEMFRKMLNS